MAMFCAFCGKQLPEGSVFCTYCGARIVNTQIEMPQENQESVHTEPKRPDPKRPDPKRPDPVPKQDEATRAKGYSEQYRDANTKWQSNAKRKRKANKSVLLIILVCVLTVALVLATGFLWPGFFRTGTTEDASVSSQPTDHQQESTAFKPPVSTEPAVTERPNPFNDISYDDPFYSSCLWALDKGILQSDTVDAEGLITRADAIIYLWRSMGCPDPANAECPFADVTAADAYYKPVLWGLEHGVISRSADSFVPDRDVTKSESIAMLFKANGGQSVDHAPFFLDTDASTWYTKSATWAYVKGILDPDSSYRFHPDCSVERGRYFLWLFRAVEPELAPDPVPVKQESFRKLGIPINLTAGGSVTFLASSKENPNRQTRLSVTSQSYEVFSEREGYSARQGYSWHVATFLVNGSASEIEGNHFEFLTTYQDANNVRLFWQEQKTDEAGNITSWVIGDDGSLRDVLVKPVERSDYAGAVCCFTVAAQIPDDYSGVCFCLCDAAKAWGEDACMADVYSGKEEFVLFQMD